VKWGFTHVHKIWELASGAENTSQFQSSSVYILLIHWILMSQADDGLVNGLTDAGLL